MAAASASATSSSTTEERNGESGKNILNSEIIARVLDTYPDLWTALRVKEKCIESTSDYPGSLIAVQVLAGLLQVYIGLLSWMLYRTRMTLLVKAMNYPLLQVFVCGAMLGTMVPMFGYPHAVLYACMIICINLCLVVMFGSLIAKSWQLKLKIQEDPPVRGMCCTVYVIRIYIMFPCACACAFL